MPAIAIRHSRMAMGVATGKERAAPGGNAIEMALAEDKFFFQSEIERLFEAGQRAG